MYSREKINNASKKLQGLPLSNTDCKQPIRNWTPETLAEQLILRKLVREGKRLGLFLWDGKKQMEYEEAPKFRFKSPFCPIPDRLYRYKFKLYRYNFATAIFLLSCTGTILSCTGTILSCTGTKLIFLFFFSFFLNTYIYIFHFWNSGATIHLDLFNCLSSQVFLHVHFFSCSNSTTDCIRRLSTVIHSWDIFKFSMRTIVVP